MRTTIRLMGLFAAGALGACGSDSSSSSDCVNPTGSNTSQYIVNSVTLPANSTRFAIDPIGDGHTHNQLGHIVALLSSQGFDPLRGADDSIRMGPLNLPIAEKTSNMTFANDSTAASNTHVDSSTPRPPPAP